MTTKQRKPRRKLSNISFDKEGAHVALVSKTQGGPANGHDYALVLKANNVSEEFVQKMQQIQVTMELPDFLKKFFGMYYDDAEILARLLGYVENTPEDEVQPQTYEDYIQSKLEAFTVLKSVFEANDTVDTLSKLSEDEYLAVLTSQEMIEKAFATQESDDSTSVVDESDTSTNAGVEKSVEPSGSESQEVGKSNMTKEVKDVAPTVEMVEKSALESIQKAFDEQKVQLEKALETIAQFEAAQKEAVEKARKEKLVAALKDENKAEVLFKAVKAVSEEEFEAVVNTLTEIQKAVDASALFKEQGATSQDEVAPKESAVAKLLKAKQAA